MRSPEAGCKVNVKTARITEYERHGGGRHDGKPKHAKWECNTMWCSWRKQLYGELGGHLGEVFRKLAEQKESRIEEGHLMPDHVHMMIAIPPKYAVSQVIGFIKGKSAIHLARVYGERKSNFMGQHFWARGYWDSTVGRDEVVIRDYIRQQEQEYAGGSRIESDQPVALTSQRKLASRVGQR